MVKTSKKKIALSSRSHSWIILLVLVILAVIGVKLSGSIVGSRASYDGYGWICVSDNGSDTAGNGGCSFTGNEMPYRTIARARQAAADLKLYNANVALMGPTYTLAEASQIDVTENHNLQLGTTPTNGDNRVAISGKFTRFNVTGNFSMNNLTFTNQSEVAVYVDGKKGFAEISGNTFNDNDLNRSFVFSSANSGHVWVERNQFNVALGSSPVNNGVYLYSQNNGEMLFINNTIIETRSRLLPTTSWLSAVNVATNLPDFKGHRYNIQQNIFRTLNRATSSDKSNQEWGFHVSTNGDPLVNLEKDNDFTQFLGLPVKREKS